VITAGIDVGTKNTKTVIMKDNEIIGRSCILTGFDLNETAEKALQEAIASAGITRDQVEVVVATGTGRKYVTFADRNVSEVSAAAKGVHYLLPNVRTVIEVGAEEGRAVKVDSDGKALDNALNEKCAAGAGSFVESMARALETTVDKLASMSLDSVESVPMNAQCVIFAESEVVSLIHQKVPKQDIARSIHDAISGRISSMTRTVGIDADVALVGGVANNIGFLKSLKDHIGVEIVVPEQPEYVGALGAALL
jgi:benzoyl-CoA reductase subunit D